MHSTFVNLVFNTRPAGGGIIILPWRVMNFVLRREKMITAHPVNSRVNNNIMRDILSSFQLSTFHCFVYTMFNHRCKFESLEQLQELQEGCHRSEAIRVEFQITGGEKRNYHRIFVHLSTHGSSPPNDRHTEFFALESRFAPVINLSPELIWRR